MHVCFVSFNSFMFFVFFLGSLKIAKYLFEMGINVELKDKEGLTVRKNKHEWKTNMNKWKKMNENKHE